MKSIIAEDRRSLLVFFWHFWLKEKIHNKSKKRSEEERHRSNNNITINITECGTKNIEAKNILYTSKKLYNFATLCQRVCTFYTRKQ